MRWESRSDVGLTEDSNNDQEDRGDHFDWVAQALLDLGSDGLIDFTFEICEAL